MRSNVPSNENLTGSLSDWWQVISSKNMRCSFFFQLCSFWRIKKKIVARGRKAQWAIYFHFILDYCSHLSLQPPTQHYQYIPFTHLPTCRPPSPLALLVCLCAELQECRQVCWSQSRGPPAAVRFLQKPFNFNSSLVLPVSETTLRAKLPARPSAVSTSQPRAPNLVAHCFLVLELSVAYPPLDPNPNQPRTSAPAPSCWAVPCFLDPFPSDCHMLSKPISPSWLNLKPQPQLSTSYLSTRQLSTSSPTRP